MCQLRPASITDFTYVATWSGFAYVAFAIDLYSRAMLDAGADLLRAALDLLDHPHGLYARTTDAVRRQLNQAIFDRLYVDVDGVTDDTLSEPFEGLLYGRDLHRPTVAPRTHRAPQRESGTRSGAARKTSSVAALLERIECVDGSSKAAMAARRGFEPLTPSMRNEAITPSAVDRLTGGPRTQRTSTTLTDVPCEVACAKFGDLAQKSPRQRLSIVHCIACTRIHLRDQGFAAHRPRRRAYAGGGAHTGEGCFGAKDQDLTGLIMLVINAAGR